MFSAAAEASQNTEMDFLLPLVADLILPGPAVGGQEIFDCAELFCKANQNKDTECHNSAALTIKVLNMPNM